MDSKIRRILDQFRHKKILIIGDAMLDVYLKGSTNRICREAPVPIVAVQDRYETGGGAANTAINVAALGAKTYFLSTVGDDIEGRQLKECLKRKGVKTDYLITDEDKHTLAKQRVVASDQMLVRFDLGNKIMSKKAEEEMKKALEQLYPTADAILISDYDYGVLTPEIIKTIKELQSIYKKILSVDSKRLEIFAPLSPTVVKPNYGEATSLLKLPQEQSENARLKQIEKYGHVLHQKLNTAIAAITLDTLGALIFSHGQEPYRTYAIPHEHANAAGAGDTYISAFTLSLAAKSGVQAASEIAALATEVVVSKPGTTICSTDDILVALSEQTKVIADRERLAQLVEEYKEQGRRIVFTNGCFDILHRGHVTYLQEAKQRGDLLIVGVNSDESVKRLKGPTRPINTLDDRLAVLSGLGSIDHVISFHEDTPINLIKIIEPDVYVKGGDYTRESLPETPIVEAYGGSIEIIPFVMDRSTTNIIKKIRDEDGELSEREEALVRIK